MTDITRLITSLKRRSAHSKDFGDDVTFVKLEDLDALVEALEKAQAINAAAEKLVRCKGRYHSEQNYLALSALFGVTTPDLPPLDSESRTVTVKLPKDHVDDADLHWRLSRKPVLMLALPWRLPTLALSGRLSDVARN